MLALFIEVGNMDEIKQVLEQYDIKPTYIESINDRVNKVHTTTYSFILKKLSNKRDPQFIKFLPQLEQSQYKNYVQIFPNRYKQLLTMHKNNFYYLMPCLQNELANERNEKHLYLFKEAAILHQRTEKEQKLNEDEASSHYESLLKKWNEEQALYERYVEQCEKQLYLAPFELQAVTYFIEVSRAIDFAKGKLADWEEEMKEKETTRIVMNHGRLSSHHFLYDEKGTGFFINLEEARMASPIEDMILFLNRTLKTYPTQCDDCVNWFYEYQQYYPFKEEEMHLFLSYLSYPASILRIIKTNAQNKQKELPRNRKLLKAYWQFKNIEYFVMRVSEIEEKKRQEKEGNEAAT